MVWQPTIAVSVAPVYKLSLDEVVLLPMIQEAAGWVSLTYDPPRYFLLQLGAEREWAWLVT